MQRRDLLKSAATTAGLTILKSGTLRGQNAPSNKLNIALIGVWGRGTAHYNTLRNENVVALCDINDIRTKEALALFPKAKTYYDWRRVLDQKDVEAVIICTADHHHAFIANWALNRGMHVYCEKPLGITVEEVRTVRANYLKNKAKLATQHGTQRHAYPNFERLRELILDGAIGELKTVHSWDARQLPRPGYPPGEGMPPAYLHYEQWIGPSPYHPYTPQYFGGVNGMNCLFWNMYRDFGVGQMGDMGAHTMDLVWNVIDAGAPSTVDFDRDLSDKFDPNITPGQAEGGLRTSGQQLARAGDARVVPGRPQARDPKELHRRVQGRQRRYLRRHQGEYLRRLHHARHRPEQRRRRLHLLQAPRQGRTVAARRRHRPADANTPAPRAKARQDRAGKARPSRRDEGMAEGGSRPARLPGHPDAGQRCAARRSGCRIPRSSRFSKPRRPAGSSSSMCSSRSGWKPAKARATTSRTGPAARRIATSIMRAR